MTERPPSALFSKQVLELYERSGSTGGLSAIVVSRKPRTYQEFVEMIEEFEAESFFGIADDFIEVIGMSQNLDEIVSQLPYDEQNGVLYFLLPPPEEQTQ